jgi:hypothetical protein
VILFKQITGKISQRKNMQADPKQRIKDFVRAGWTDAYEFCRLGRVAHTWTPAELYLKENGKPFNLHHYDWILDKFMTHQERIIDALTEEQVRQALTLMDIIKGRCYNLDKEHMIPYRTSGFCYHKDGSIIIFNER